MIYKKQDAGRIAMYIKTHTRKNGQPLNTASQAIMAGRSSLEVQKLREEFQVDKLMRFVTTQFPDVALDDPSESPHVLTPSEL
ncbi:hypothetical protein CCACVL1_07668 [Corchorus capsularis]|uniref:Uncharacterized protein n=1 Tax=Corchorus capsularis TaxID=210143 RepID=A0A1R3J4H0_COCAP|nr:hypothetical protein CCACVL1_07668 [Corchorus capsularis]